MEEKSNDASLHLIRRHGSQSLEQKPKTHDQLEQSHRRIEDAVIHDFVEGGENEIGQCADVPLIQIERANNWFLSAALAHRS